MVTDILHFRQLENTIQTMWQKKDSWSNDKLHFAYPYSFFTQTFYKIIP